jgi:hypothetical protein
MSSKNISIRKIKNVGYMDLIIASDDFEISLMPGASAPVDALLGEPGTKKMITVIAKVLANKFQTIWLLYTEQDAMNHFEYTTAFESEETHAVKDPTTPGSDVVLSIGYSGDGVVIVGTGDM